MRRAATRKVSAHPRLILFRRALRCRVNGAARCLAASRSLMPATRRARWRFVLRKHYLFVFSARVTLLKKRKSDAKVREARAESE